MTKEEIETTITEIIEAQLFSLKNNDEMDKEELTEKIFLKGIEFSKNFRSITKKLFG